MQRYQTEDEHRKAMRAKIDKTIKRGRRRKRIIRRLNKAVPGICIGVLIAGMGAWCIAAPLPDPDDYEPYRFQAENGQWYTQEEYEQMSRERDAYHEEDQSQFFPYFIVRIEEGNTPTDDEPWLVGTTVLFGICDYDKETNGHRTILEMITKITNRFLERPLLDSKFRANQNVSFALQDEDTYPFYFGAIDIKFYVPKIGRSDDWS